MKDRLPDSSPNSKTWSEKTGLFAGVERASRFLSRRPIPFQVVAPSLVLGLGALVVLVMTLLGLHQLDLQMEEGASFRAETLTNAAWARLEATAPDEAEAVVASIAKKTRTTMIVLDTHGDVILASPKQPLAENDLKVLRVRGEGAALSPRAGEIAAIRGAVGDSRLVVLSPIPESQVARASLIASLITFAVLLLSAAGLVAWALARDVHADVLYLRGLIVKMANEEKAPESNSIAVRTIDQVGQLTASFNTLLERFRAAERVYRQDLTEVSAFDRDRSAFLSALSHELRTPLNAILGFADVLLSEIDGPLSEEAHENLTIVRTSGEHLRSLIDDILTLSALESGEFRLSREELDLYQVANDVVTEARVTAEAKGLRLELARPVGAQTIALADRRRVRQVLGNVVGNAVKFTTKGSILVEVTREEPNILLRVTDTGPGIERTALERIFEEFEQSSAGAAQRTGTGLGLSITRRLVHLHGGSVRAESTLGEGSTFFIRIPIQPPVPATNPPLVRAPQTPIVVKDKLPG